MSQGSLFYGSALKPGGNILPSSFVKLDASNDFQVLQATGGTDIPVAISMVGTDQAPIPSVTTQYAGQLGDPWIDLFWPGQPCLLVAGSGGFARGQLLMSDANGAGIPATSGNYVGAMALQSATYQAYGYVVPMVFKI